MRLTVTFLGSQSRDLLHSFGLDASVVDSKPQMISLTHQMLILSDLFLEGLSSFKATSVASTKERVWSAGLAHPTRIDYVRRVQLALVGCLEHWEVQVCQPRNFRIPAADTVCDVSVWRELMSVLADYLLILEPCIATSVSHLTIREWLSGVCGQSLGRSASHYLISSTGVRQKLVSQMDAGADPSIEWLEGVFKVYQQRDVPMKRSEMIALGVDLADLYRAQIVYASRALPGNRSSASNGVIEEDICDYVASAIDQWTGSGAVKLPRTGERYADGRFWESILHHGGSQVFFVHGHIQVSGRYTALASGGASLRPGWGQLCSPLLVRRILANQAIGSVCSRVASRYDQMISYYYCASLEDLVDAATLPAGILLHGQPAPQVLITPLRNGWVLLVDDADHWHVRYIGKWEVIGDSVELGGGPLASTALRGGTPIRAMTPFQSLKSDHLPKLCTLGFIPFSESSGAIYDRLMDFADRI